jgi:hypothetical protein
MIVNPANRKAVVDAAKEAGDTYKVMRIKQSGNAWG